MKICHINTYDVTGGAARAAHRLHTGLRMLGHDSQRPTFVAYIQQCLAPMLHRRDTVIMDNLAAHKVAGVREAIEAVGERLQYLPQYSPDFNPIEQGFSKVKAYLRKAAERTIEGPCRRIGLIVRSFSAQECANFVELFGVWVNVSGICSSTRGGRAGFRRCHKGNSRESGNSRKNGARVSTRGASRARPGGTGKPLSVVVRKCA